MLNLRITKNIIPDVQLFLLVEKNGHTFTADSFKCGIFSTNLYFGKKMYFKRKKIILIENITYSDVEILGALHPTYKI